ncbi:MAG: VWA domain-containing protein, partial [Phycisphaerae bacterium]|nr:VWA domain-containing protein [Phycisphaerae bacterium]
MVTLESPIWLVLVIPLAVSLFVWRMPSRLLMGIRIAVLVLLLLALAQLAVTLPQRGGYVVVVADRSRSMPESAEQAHGEAIRIVQSEMGESDRLAVVSFGDGARVEHAPQAGGFGGFVQQVGPHASNLHDALETALALVPADAPGRILVMSDGRWTGRDPVGVAARAAARSVAVDHRLLQRPAAGDLAIAEIDAPASVHPQEAFMLTAWVRSATSGEIDYELLRGRTRLAAGRRQVRAGLNRLTFRDLAEDPGTLAYVLRVKATATDPVPENNTARILVGVSGPRAILHLTEKPDSGLGRLLSSGGLEIRRRAPEDVNWSLPELSN